MTATQRGGVLVTGASSGIGEATAAHLEHVDFRVCGTVRREEDAAALRSTGVIPILMDVTSDTSITSAVQDVQEALGDVPLVGIVNNAGIPGAGPLEMIPMDQIRHVFDVNFFGLLAVTRAFLPQLKRHNGRIINISSVSARTHYPLLGPYAASKAAVEAMTHSLRRELIPFNVGVTIIRPGSVQTRIWDTVEKMDMDYLEGSVYEPLARRLMRIAVSGGKRGLRPDAVARAVERALMRTRPPICIDVVQSRVKSLLTSAMPKRVMDGFVKRKVWGESSGGSSH